MVLYERTYTLKVNLIGIVGNTELQYPDMLENIHVKKVKTITISVYQSDTFNVIKQKICDKLLKLIEYENDSKNTDIIKKTCIYCFNHKNNKIISSNNSNNFDIESVISDAHSQIPLGRFADPKEIEDGLEVFAVGHPMGMVWTISKGIVSSTNRYSRHPYIKSVQTDAAINKGNSGGPLFNSRGEVVGITNMGIMVAESLNFAIPKLNRDSP